MMDAPSFFLDFFAWDYCKISCEYLQNVVLLDVIKMILNWSGSSY